MIEEFFGCKRMEADADGWVQMQTDGDGWGRV
jgi:hypothetical protein